MPSEAARAISPPTASGTGRLAGADIGHPIATPGPLAGRCHHEKREKLIPIICTRDNISAPSFDPACAVSCSRPSRASRRSVAGVGGSVFALLLLGRIIGRIDVVKCRRTIAVYLHDCRFGEIDIV